MSPARGTGLAGAGGLDVDVDTIRVTAALQLGCLTPNFRLSKEEGVEALFRRLGPVIGPVQVARTGPTPSGTLSSPEIQLFQCRPFRFDGTLASTRRNVTLEPRCIALLHLPPIVSTLFRRRDRPKSIGRQTAAPPTLVAYRVAPQAAAKAFSDSVDRPSCGSSPRGPARGSIALPTVSVRNLAVTRTAALAARFRPKRKKPLNPGR